MNGPDSLPFPCSIPGSWGAVPPTTAGWLREGLLRKVVSPVASFSLQCFPLLFRPFSLVPLPPCFPNLIKVGSHSHKWVLFDTGHHQMGRKGPWGRQINNTRLGCPTGKSSAAIKKQQQLHPLGGSFMPELHLLQPASSWLFSHPRDGHHCSL